MLFVHWGAYANITLPQDQGNEVPSGEDDAACNTHKQRQHQLMGAESLVALHVLLICTEKNDI